MEKKKTILKKQAVVIIVVAVLAVVVAIACIVFPYVFKEELNTVYEKSEYGDEVEILIFDKKSGTYLNGDIEAMLSGEKKNSLFVKTGKEEGTKYTFHRNDVQITYRPYIVPEIPKSNVKRITVTNENGTFSVFNDGKENFFVEGAERNLYNQQLLSSLVFQSRYLLADGYVEKAGDVAEYGLTDETCSAKIVVETTDGSVHTLLMGNKVIGSSQYYMKHSDKKNIYLITGTDVFLEDMLIYLNPVVINPIEEQARNYLDTFSYKRNGELFFECERIPDSERVGAYSNQLHRMTYPEDEFVLNTETLYEMFNQIGGLSGAGVVEYGVLASENPGEIFEKYGLINSTADISFTLGDAEYKLLVGNMEEYNEEQYYYVYSVYQDTVVMVPASSMTFLEYEIIDLFQKGVYQHSINDVASIKLTTGGTVREYVLSGEGENLKVTERNSGKTIDTPSFRQFYISVLNVKIADYSKYEGNGAEKLGHVLSYVVTLKSGEMLHFDFYSESTLNCYMVVDGKGGFKADRKLINTIAEHSDMLMNGQKIESVLG